MNTPSKNLLLGGLAIAVVAGAAVLLYSVRSGSDGAGVAQATTSTYSARSGSPGDRPNVTQGGAPAVSDTDSESDRPPMISNEERSTVEMSYVLARSVPRRIREWVGPCYDSAFSYKTLEDDDHHIDIEYTLVLQDGVFSLRDVKMTGRIGKPELEACILEGVAEIKWRAANGETREYSVPMSDELTLLELAKFGEPMDDDYDPSIYEPDFGPKADRERAKQANP